MKYRDLVQFEPIETVIELRDAAKTDKARQLVKTYVISEPMARQLSDVIAAHLDFTHLDAKGLFIVGNYGTGKSHMMAVVSALAENADLLPDLQHDGVRNAFAPAAGRYLVCRFEIGAVKTPLRDIIIRELEKSLKHWGVDYTFPPVDRITNHKDAIEAMLAAVEAKYPGKGVLLVVDELLDYLKALGEGAVSAFNFLRELGEASGNGRFRTIAGVQESLVSSPNFGFLASLIQKVSARFAEVWITREDLAFVVESRLLKKTTEQRNWIREHLERFMPMFPTMSAQRDDFIRLFPVHPRYLQVFEEVEIAEKREVLKTLSQEMARRLDDDVPADEPGVVSYDSYWQRIKQQPTLLAHPDVGLVEQRSSVIAGKVETSFPKTIYKAAAGRVVDALSVFRLAVGGIRTQIGLSATDLRDDLALTLPVPERDPEFLKTTIESILKDIKTTVGGQFIGSSEATGQYYLDVDRAIDYDAEVDKKARSLEPVPEKFDLYYFDLLSRVLEMASTTHVPGMRIWQHEVEWAGHNVTRPGYLFFGSPNERSTAQPPRTFYIYFLAHFAPTAFEDAKRDDEVILRLARPDEDFAQRVKRYAAAVELAGVTSGDEKSQYQAIAQRHQREATRWLSENLIRAFDIATGGMSRAVGTAAAEPRAIKGTSTPRDLLNALAGTALAPGFERRFPGYPRFAGLDTPVTEANRPQAASEGLKYLAGSIKTAQGAAVLDGLKLRDAAGVIATADSPYAARIAKALAAKPEGHVLNRSELIETIDGAEVDPQTHLEPEWVAVVLLAMAYRGEIEITAGAGTIDAATLTAALALGAEGLGRFRSIQRPKAEPTAALTVLMEMFGLNSALLGVDKEQAVVEIQTAAAKDVTAALEVMAKAGGAQLGGAPLWEQGALEELRTDVGKYKDFLDRLASINTPGKLRQFRTTVAELDLYESTRATLRGAQARLGRLASLEPIHAYLKDAQGVLHPEDPWQAEAAETIADAATGVESDASLAAAASALANLKTQYAARYIEMHDRARLDNAGDDKKVRILSGDLMKRLSSLETVQMLGGLAPLKSRLASLIVCRQVDAITLADRAWCTACHFKPSVESTAADAKLELAAVEQALEDLNRDWSAFLHDSLDDPIAAQGLSLLDDAAAAAVRAAADPDNTPSTQSIQYLNQVLGGLEKVVLASDQVLAALRAGGPASPDDLEARLADLVRSAVAGKDQSKLRVVVE